MIWEPKPQACPLCGAAERKAIGRRGGDAHRARLGVTTTIVRCRRCHALYQSPVLIPSGNPYVEHEADDYFCRSCRKANLRLGEELAATAQGYLGRKGRLLELGCGRGDILVGARAIGWTVRGVDMTPGFVARDSGIEVEIAPVESAQSLHERWDFIVMGAILEHLYDPRTCLERVRNALAPGGVVFIDVPNECGLWSHVGNLYMRLRGHDWSVNMSPTFPPFHVVGFCPRSLTRVLEQTGFEILQLRTYRSRLSVPGADSVLSGIENRVLDGVLALGVRLGMGAGVMAWARRP